VRGVQISIGRSAARNGFLVVRGYPEREGIERCRNRPAKAGRGVNNRAVEFLLNVLIGVALGAYVAPLLLIYWHLTH
jgi:hypothetical protein